MANKAIFLDRDGTINVDHGYVHKIDDFQFIEGVGKALWCGIRWHLLLSASS